MAQSFVSPIVSFSIASGATGSNIVSGIKDARALGVFSPALLAAIRVQVALSATAIAGNHVDLTSGGATVKAQSRSCVVMTDVAFRSIRLLANAAVSGPKTFQLGKRWES